ncbi:MAG: hypothetical protein B7C24_05845 [Bacteroidetes bacterium 4572_77]|nr:MAG: hypothetical protein B7C24_05845 [Bacteroidetes bacterium 4572_77]
MKDELENIKKIFSSYIEIGEKEWEDFSSQFEIRKIMKRRVIQNEGEICKYLYFVDKGLIRVFLIDENGDEKTIHFALENTFIAEYQSLLHNTPSDYTFQALETSRVVLISFDTLQFAYEHLKYGDKLGRLLAEEYIFHYAKKQKNIYTKTPFDRYLHFNEYYPDVIKRVPQHYIASYLNISSVHLSRLINQENKTK